MCDVGSPLEPNCCDAGMEQVDRVLHDLCQPLTTLRCRLELAALIGTVEAYREAVQLGLVECVRLVEGVESMREIVCAAKQE